MTVVKADAYGHGMIKCVEALEKLGARKPDYYGVSSIDEAVELRKSRRTKSPILSFAPFDISELREYFHYRVIPSITSIAQIRKLKREKLNRKLKVHVNVDTGMGRLGLAYKTAAEEIKKLSEIQNIIIDGVYTHFACSDEKDKSFTNLQIKGFDELLKKLHELNIDTGTVHASNSGAILDHPDAYYDMVRPGISLYGYYPSQETTESVKLKPAMTLYSYISELKKINKGETVSYGRIFTAGKDSITASVPIGYADGYNRNLSNSATGIIRNKSVRQIGRVTMDRIIFDVSGIKAKLNDKIILLGNSKDFKFDAWDWASLLKTIPYEITCGISKRVPRVYKD